MNATGHKKLSERMFGMREGLINKLKSEKGVVEILEATIVFPVMFVILLLLILMGNAYYLKAQLEAIAESYALQGAAYCSDPILETMKKEGKAPSLDDLEIKPYRYINVFGNMKNIESTISKEIKEKFDNGTISLFDKMTPELKTDVGKIAKYNNYLVYSTFSVDLECDVELPVAMVWSGEKLKINYTSRANVAVNDSAEFIRNTDMVVDLFPNASSKIRDTFAKVTDFINDLAGK